MRKVFQIPFFKLDFVAYLPWVTDEKLDRGQLEIVLIYLPQKITKQKICLYLTS